MSTLKIIRAARVLPSSQANVVLGGAVCLDIATGLIVDVGPFQYIRELHPLAAVQDLGDATLMPGRQSDSTISTCVQLMPVRKGLFDCHVHLIFNPYDNEYPPKKEQHASFTEEMALARMTSNSYKLLDAGVTTARDLGCPGNFSVVLRDRINNGKQFGPRLVCLFGPTSVRLDN